MNTPITITVSDKSIYDTLITALEQGIGYWGIIVRSRGIFCPVPQWMVDMGRHHRSRRPTVPELRISYTRRRNGDSGPR